MLLKSILIHPFVAAGRLWWVLGLCVLLFPEQSFAQYFLPRAEVLAENGVKSLRVIKTPLRMEDRDENDVTPAGFDKTPQQMVTYFFNSRGFIDSIYYYPSDVRPYDTKKVYRYDAEDRLVEVKAIGPKGELMQRQWVERTPENGWNCKVWDQGFLSMETVCTEDSIAFEIIRYDSDKPNEFKTTYTYNLEQEIRRDHFYHNGEIVAKETCQWIAEDGIPKRFVYDKYERDGGENKPKEVHAELDMDGEGNVVNKLQGTIFDPFRTHNYYKRYEMFEGVGYPYDLFRLDALEAEKEASELYTFDGVHVLYRYSFLYD